MLIKTRGFSVLGVSDLNIPCNVPNAHQDNEILRSKSAVF